MKKTWKGRTGNLILYAAVLTLCAAMTAGMPAVAETEAETPAGGEEVQDPDLAGDEKEMAADTERDHPETGPAESETSESETAKPETEKQAQKKMWFVTVSDITPDLPEGGRVYDGTDHISVSFRWDLTPEKQEDEKGDGNEGDEKPERPEAEVTCRARLDSPDAGVRRVEYEFDVKTDDKWKDHVVFLPENPHPDLEVLVQKKVLAVRIPDGKKVYAQKADTDHIWPYGSDVADMNKDYPGQKKREVPEELRLKASVTGFLTDAEGNMQIPEGFRPPELAVDPEILKDMSPMYKDGNPVLYENALVMKRNDDGTLTGDPTGNYTFCEDPASPDYIRGSVEVVAGRISEGDDYELETAGIKHSPGRLMLKSGGSFRIRPSDKSVYNKGYEKSGVRSDGRDAFTLKKTDSDGQLLAESLPDDISWQVDGMVPEPEIRLTGGTLVGGVRYTSDSALCEVIPRGDDRSGLKEVSYRIRKGNILPEGGGSLASSGEWIKAENDSPSVIRLDQEGVWQVEAFAEDQVGNRSEKLGGIVVIDRKKPTCLIYGAADKSANSGEVRLSFSCTDSFYRKGSVKITVTPSAGSYAPRELSRNETEHGAVIYLDDFAHQRSADAWYHATIRADDLAGNTGEAELDFSVNRYGSTYGLDSGTLRQTGSYYHRKPFDITFLETNLDEVTEPEILVMRNGKKLKKVRMDREVQPAGPGGDGMRHYRYVIHAETFAEDGVYEVILMTIDRAGNTSDSQLQKIPVRFAIDKTKPECLISGIAKNGKYTEKQITAVAEVRDNLAVQSAAVYLNSGIVKEYSASALKKSGGILKIAILSDSDWQYLQIRVKDRAGNEFWTEEYPVFVSEEKKIPPERKSVRSAREIAQERERRLKLQKVSGSSADPVSGDEPPVDVTRIAGETEALKTEWRSMQAGEGLIQPAGIVQEGQEKDQTRERNRRAILPGLLSAAAFAVISAGSLLSGRRRKSSGHEGKERRKARQIQTGRD